MCLMCLGRNNFILILISVHFMFMKLFSWVVLSSRGVDALSRKNVLINILSSKLIGFECLNALYPKDHVFAQILQDFEEREREMCMRNRSSTPYSKFNGFLFKGKRFSVPMSSWRE